MRDQRDVEFRNVWRLMSVQSMCDGIDGAEFNRVYAEWVSAGRPRSVTVFIRRRANIGPDAPEFDPQNWRK